MNAAKNLITPILDRMKDIGSNQREGERYLNYPRIAILKAKELMSRISKMAHALKSGFISPELAMNTWPVSIQRIQNGPCLEQQIYE